MNVCKFIKTEILRPLKSVEGGEGNVSEILMHFMMLHIVCKDIFIYKIHVILYFL